ncbi:uncharacterized protein BDR25DRAFT_262767 [Lindgomyces ingoldianus]|uniref:Uncharacterized protein n=1 Tax=Lindgomyces ingoldianus TaxID=673940 RepID=A0ACB6QVI6_9PLEO|nr:uncharacterized protein BDR25DRAFT_262767 [Lindgomyces ingoldianus]KAF2470105.1 hypothetical protein BDR25DRAFT_262767 [Lindgomyces ingoldianus]
MTATLKPIKRVKCTYQDCQASFDTEKEMKRHKKYSVEHDYCQKCDEDFESYDELANHKAYRPDNHGKACRVCGEEFKSVSGLKRHIELAHRVDQKLPCIGCGEEFYRASLLIEHLEFGHCSMISSSQFQGHIVHKFLITQLLKGGPEYDRFLQKISKHNAAVDDEDSGGVSLGLMDEEAEELHDVEFQAIKPDIPAESINLADKIPKPWPLLPSQAKSVDADSGLLSPFSKLSVDGDDDSTAVASTADESYVSATSRQFKVWGSGRSSSTLFPKAKPTPTEWSIAEHDQQLEEEHGINILATRFWDPTSTDYNAERFFEPITGAYRCPFPCEQAFDIPADLNKHIMDDHRITTMRCPSCLKKYRSATALVAHCESRSSKCRVSQAEDFNVFLDRLTGGFLSVDEKTRPEFIYNPTVTFRNSETGVVERYKPPTASYLQYETTKPADWKEPERKTGCTIGGGGGNRVGLPPAWK